MMARQGERKAKTNKNSLADLPCGSDMMVQDPMVRSSPNWPHREREVGTRKIKPQIQVLATCSGNHCRL